MSFTVVMRKPRALFGVEQAVLDVVIAQVEAQRGHGLSPQQHVRPLIGELAAEDKAVVLLLDLVAMDGIVEEIGEIGKQVEIVIKPIGHGGRCVELPSFRCQSASSE